MQKPEKNILVIRLSAMGDVAIMTPLLMAFHAKYPSCHITILTKPFFTPIFNGLPNVSVITIDVNGKHKGFFGLVRLANALKRQKYDAVADLHNVLRTKILKFLLPNSIPFVQIDKGRAHKKKLVQGKLFKQLPSSFERYAEVFKKLGFPLSLEQTYFVNKPNPTTAVKQLFDRPKKLIGLAPLAAFKSKTYPLAQMKKVVEILSQEYAIALLGAKAQKDRLNELVINENVINLAGAFSFDEELQLIAHLDAMVSMDSGNAHLAAMYGVKTLTIWGTTHPYAGFLPYGQSIENTVLADRKKYPKIPTSIYGNKAPEGYENAIASIKPDEIIAKFNTMMKS